MGHVQAGADDVRIEMLGHVRVAFEDREIIESDWPARRPRELVALLALADGHRLARDQVIEQLWPHLGAEAGAANLRKAAHHARRTLNDLRRSSCARGVSSCFPRVP
jgi:DNA-binding SARP family transcriptional activator